MLFYTLQRLTVWRAKASLTQSNFTFYKPALQSCDFNQPEPRFIYHNDWKLTKVDKASDDKIEDFYIAFAILDSVTTDNCV